MRVLKILLCGLLLALPVFAEEAEDRQTATSLHYVSHELDTRQDKLSTGANAALTYTNSAGGVEQRTVKSDLTGGTTDTSLPTVAAVNTGLNQKQDDIGAINDHTAVTYTGQTGEIGQKGIYQDTGTYAEQTDNLIDAKTFNAALKNGLDSEFVCGGTKPGTDTCWLWQIHNESINLFDKDGGWTHGWFMDPTGGNNTLGDAPTSNHTAVIRCTPNTTYYLKHTSGRGGGRMFYCESEEYNVGTTTCSAMVGPVVAEPNEVTHITTSANAKWLFVIYGRLVDSVGSTLEEQAADTMLSTVPLTAETPYEPYGNIYIPQNQQ